MDWGILKQADSDVWARGEFWDLNPDFSGKASNVMSSTNKIEGKDAFPKARLRSTSLDRGSKRLGVQHRRRRFTKGLGASHLCGFDRRQRTLQAKSHIR